MIWRTPLALAVASIAVFGLSSAGFSQDAGEAEQKVEAADQKAQQPAAPNPLGNLIRNLFRKPARANGNLAQQNAENADKNQPANGDRTARDHIDARAPYDPSQSKELRSAESLMQDGQWRMALERLQRLLDRPDDSLVRRPDGQWVSVRQEANRLLGEFPPDSMQTYRLQYGGYAAALLQDARREQNLAKFVQVAATYFHTEAGQQAANYLGTSHFDRGEFGMAARWFELLLDSRSPVAQDPKWRLKAAFALKQAGDPQASDRLLQGLVSANAPRLELGGTAVDPDAWLNRNHAVRPQASAELHEWPLFYGTPSHTGTAAGGEPLLLPRWFQPITTSQPVRELIETMAQDLADDQRATIPAIFPLMVDDRIVFRSLRGVQVVEAATGKPLWEVRDAVSAEEILTGTGGDDPYAGEQVRVVRGPWGLVQQQYHGHNADQHQLTSLLFRDGTHGILSSDGGQLFVLEDHAIISRNHHGYNVWGGFDPAQSDPLLRSWSSNKIVAYDLATGRPRWQIGGPQMNEPFDLPLAGTYFYGTPTPAGSTLYVVGEKDQQIRLHALDAETGRPKWDQLLAYCEVKIEQDLGRRLWTSQVAIADGVAVCPTTVGWLVGVNILDHSILWAKRYSQPNREPQNHPGVAMAQPGELNSRWSPAAPIIVGNRLFYTPSEEPLLVCLDLFDGEILWQRQKEEFLYLAGAFDDRLLLVGKSSLTALSVENGQTLWSLPIASEDGHPSGIGIASGNHYHLPLHSGQLWTIDWQTGTVVSRSWLPDGQPALGNLAMYDGMLLSMGPSGLSSFEQREAVDARISARKQKNPRDPWALLREADIHLLKRDYSAALAALQKIAADAVLEEQQDHYRAAMIDSLTALVRTDFQTHDQELDQLEAFVESDDERLAFQRLLAERLQARNELRPAFDLYWTLSGQDDAPPVTLAGDVPVTVPFHRWLAGRLHDLWQQLPEDDRAAVEPQILEAARQLADDDRAGRERFALLFGFHPAAVAVRQQLVESYAAAGEPVRAENLLLRLARHDDPAVAAGALERLGRLWADAGLKRDAGAYLSTLQRRFPQTTLSGGNTPGELIAGLQTSGAIETPESERPLSWGDVDLKLVRTGTNYDANELQDVDLSDSDAPFFRAHRFEYYQQHQRLAVLDASDDQVHWLLPLRSAARHSSGNQVAARTAGHLLFLLHHDVLHALSPVDRQVLWTRPLDSGDAASQHRTPNRRGVLPMQTASAVANQNVLGQEAATGGLLAVVNAEYLCVYGRRDFSVLDPLTGKVRWTCDKIPPHTMIIGNQDAVFVVPQDRTKAFALRALDGKPLEIPGLPELLSRAVRLTDQGLVMTANSGSAGLLGLSNPQTNIRLYDPLARRDVWKVTLPGKSHLSLLDDRHLLILEPEGRPKLLDLNTGKSLACDKLDESEFRAGSQLYALADQHRVYLMTNGPRRSRYYYSESVPSLQVNGPIAAFDRRTGTLLWTQKAAGQNLILQHLGHSPILTFAARTYVRKGAVNYWTLSVLAIDKQTGRRLIEAKAPSNSGFRSLEISMSERYVQLTSYNERIRLVAEDQTATAEKP